MLGCLPAAFIAAVVGGAALIPVASEPIPVVTPTPVVHPTAIPGHIEGVASYFAAVEGQAAAGPALRAFLGPKWRGMTVRVCVAQPFAEPPTPRCVRVVLSDWMRRDRLVDLSKSDFAKLAKPSRGLTAVTVEKL